MPRHRSTAAVWFAGLFGGIVGAFGSTLLPADPASPPARVVPPDLDALVAKLEGSIDRRVAERIEELPQWTAPKTQPLEAGNLIQRTATRESNAPSPADVVLIEGLRTTAPKGDRIRALELHTAGAQELSRRFLFRTYREIVAELGFPAGTTIGQQGAVRFQYRYRRATGTTGTLEFLFLDGIVLGIHP